MKIGLMLRPVNEESTWLLKHRNDVTSQSGEDGIIAKIFEVIGEHGKICVECGAWDGKYCSNTHTLIRHKGWTGYLIETDAERFKTLQETYRGNPNAKLINRLVRLDRGDGTMDEILAEHGCPAEIDLLSIDIDGSDYYIWEGMADCSAKVVVIEFNPSIPNDVIFVQDRSFEINEGCSLLALVGLAREKGYELVCVTQWNAIFVRIEYFDLFNIDDNSPDAMYQPLRNGRIFCGYDGTIHVVGLSDIWGIKVSDEDFQVLPRSLRIFNEAKS